MNEYTVLLFHSIDERDLLSIKDLGNIRPELFRKVLVALKKEFDIVGLKELVECISGKSEKQGRLLSLTFDDGPKSYASNAVPIMGPLGIPSACFLITDCLGDKAIYWRYLYNYCIHRGLGKELAGLIKAGYDAPVQEVEIVSFTRKNFSPKKNRRIIEGITSRLVSEEEYRETEKGLFLSYSDIDVLKRDPLVSLGIHTRTHPVMSGLSDEEIAAEISGSLDFYKRWVKDDAPMFSVPFGRLYKDYDERTVITAQGLSVEVIFSAYGGRNNKGQPLYNIRRIPVSEGVLERGLASFVDLIKDYDVPTEYIEKEKKLSGYIVG